MTPEERQALLDTPAFGPGSEEGKVEVKEEMVTKPEGEVTKEKEPAESEEESKVPYSRFKKFHDEAAEYKAKYEELVSQRETERHTTENKEDEPDARWTKLWGDSPEAKEAWKVQKERDEDIVSRAEQKALEAVKNEKYQESERIEQNIEALDSEFEILQDFVGRKLTEEEQDSILDIVDNYSQVGENGKYIAKFPMDKAWEIYELKSQATKTPKKIARDNVSSLLGNRSEGESSEKEERDKNFNPMDWNAYQKRL